jgi:hypothetical protein
MHDTSMEPETSDVSGVSNLMITKSDVQQNVNNGGPSAVECGTPDLYLNDPVANPETVTRCTSN